MVKGIDIDLYIDGYKTSAINCVDLPLAACTGYYNRKNYFYYCLCYNYILNWKLFFKDNWLEIRKNILDCLGLKIEKIDVSENENIIDKIAFYISQDYPIFFVVKYGSLFYSKYYNCGTYDHGLIVSDFNDENRTVGIRDREVVKDLINKGIISCDIFQRLQIKNKEMEEIWEKSNKVFENEKSYHYKSFYCIKTDRTRIDFKFKQNFFEIINREETLENQLEKYVLHLNSKIDDNKEIISAEMENARRIYLNSFYVFWDVTQKNLLDFESNEMDKQIIQTAFDKFINNRVKIIDKMQRDILKKKEIFLNSRERIFEEDTNYFKKFLKILIIFLE